MSCHRNSKMCFFDPYSALPMPSCCSDHLIQVIHYITELLDKENIPYWIHFGTLLGAVRNKSTIPWDSDADIGLFVEDKDKVLALKALDCQFIGKIRKSVISYV